MIENNVYNEFKKYYILSSHSDSFEQGKESWIMCNKIAESNNVDIVKLMELYQEESRELFYEALEEHEKKYGVIE